MRRNAVPTTRGEIDAEGKPRFQGFEGFGAGAGGPGASDFPGRPPAAATSISNSISAAGRGGGGGFDASDLFADLFGNAGPAWRRGPAGADAAKRAPTPRRASRSAWPKPWKGTTARVALPDRSHARRLGARRVLRRASKIRLKGQGYASPVGGEAGDAMVTVQIAKAPPISRWRGRDLRLDLPVTLYEAVLGAKVNVPTLNGAVELAVPAGSSGGRTLRLRGKGLPNAQGGAGDLFVTLRIVLPETADPELTALMRKWEADKRYDPRKDLI